MAKAKAQKIDYEKLAKKLGVTPGTLRARKTRGQDIFAPRQVRLTEPQRRRVAKSTGPTAEVAEKYGVSESTVKRLRRILGGR